MKEAPGKTIVVAVVKCWIHVKIEPTGLDERNDGRL